MKTKTKRDVKQAERFLGDLQVELCGGFQNIAEYLTMYESHEIDKEAVFRTIVNEIKQNPQILRRFNEFLLPEKRVYVIPATKIQEMLTFLLEELNKKYSGDLDTFHSFIDFFYLISKERIDRVCFTSYAEMVAHTLREIHNSPEIQDLGKDFIADIEAIMHHYMEKVQAEPPILYEPEPEPEVQTPPEKVESNGAVQSKPQTGSTTVNKKTKSRPPANQATENTVVRAPPVQTQQAPPVSVKPPEPVPEEPPSDNLRVEENVFKALRHKLATADYNCIMKNLYLYLKNVISYFEFVKLSEKLLIKVEKEVCMALKDIVEGRERSRTANNVFNIKLQLQELENKNENRSYKRIITVELNSDANENPLINKTYMATAHGNESAVNFDEGIHKKAVKNLSEETLFKVEDEIHEFDSIIHQTQVALTWIRTLAKRNLPNEKALELCRKLANIRILNYLYGAKGSQIIDELKNRPPELLDLVEKRIHEKLEILKAARAEFSEKHWQQQQAGNYYKALDARSNSLKFAEKRFFNNKGFLGRMKDGDRSDQVIVGDSLSALLGHGGTKTIEMPAPATSDPNFWNPIICFSLKDKAIMSDIVFFLRTFVKISKMSGNEKERANNFIDRVICNFLRIPAPSSAVRNSLPNKDDLLAKIVDFERHLYPHKGFYYSDKLTLKIDESNYTNAKSFLQSVDFSRNQQTSNNGSDGKDSTDPSKNKAKDSNRQDRETKVEGAEGTQNNPANNDANNTQARPNPHEMIIEVQDPCSAIHSSYYSSQQFYLIYQYFILLYERFEYASHFSKASFGNNGLYEFFKQILFMQLFGILDISQYEDAIRMLFDHQSGVFLNFDKLLHNCVKNIPNDEFSAFVLNLNSEIFDSQSASPKIAEQVLFAKTYIKLIEQSSANSRASKNNTNAVSIVNPNAGELLKFEINFERGMFIVHRVRTALEVDTKAGVTSPGTFIEQSLPIMSRPVIAQSAPKTHGRVKKVAYNSIVHFLDLMKQELAFGKSGTEDVAFSFHNHSSLDARKKRICKLKKVKKFREARQTAFTSI
jgi:histone deacetylase complex regulatory component SIN3